MLYQRAIVLSSSIQTWKQIILQSHLKIMLVRFRIAALISSILVPDDKHNMTSILVLFFFSAHNVLLLHDVNVLYPSCFRKQWAYFRFHLVWFLYWFIAAFAIWYLAKFLWNLLKPTTFSVFVRFCQTSRGGIIPSAIYLSHPMFTDFMLEEVGCFCRACLWPDFFYDFLILLSSNSITNWTRGNWLTSKHTYG